MFGSKQLRVAWAFLLDKNLFLIPDKRRWRAEARHPLPYHAAHYHAAHYLALPYRTSSHKDSKPQKGKSALFLVFRFRLILSCIVRLRSFLFCRSRSGLFITWRCFVRCLSLFSLLLPLQCFLPQLL